ncbi:MAG TPA: 2-oxo acid dehydrogenase subunit E2 [Steroidobacteraceae bacterium]|jgi:2-oxoglutarate dehydrogenase E2 component (dihydrolipoamide succinyltransferase)
MAADIEDIVVPANQEGTRATVLRWSKRAGDMVERDEPLLELETDKVVVEVSSPASGELLEILKNPDQEVAPGEVLGRVRASAADEPAGASKAAPVTPAAGPPLKVNDERSRELLSPAVRRLLANHRLNADAIEGTGRNGRITAQDVTRHLGHPQLDERPEASFAGAGEAANSTRIPHSAMRKRIAEHMARSLAVAPHVTTLFEADLTRIMAHRAKHADAFRRRSVNLTLSAYFVQASSEALRRHPQLNATFHEDALELHGDINIGVGTALGDQGLIVPVIKGTQHMNLGTIAERLGVLVNAARNNALKATDVRGGTFTISNHGVGGSLLAAPIIINQPQVAILGVGKAQRRVCVIEQQGSEAIAIRSMAYLTLTIDHRAVDAFQANAFLSTVVEVLENWPED